MKKYVTSFLLGNSLPDDKQLNVIYAIFRSYAGISMALGAGLPKMEGGMAPDWFVKQVGEIGFVWPSPVFWATVASWGEFIGGICIAVGLLTRLSAVQLAFQFFVVAFIWYKEPAPIVGMYYQQLLFWVFVLIASAGSGKYSLDRWLLRRKTSWSRVAAPAAASLVLLLAGTGLSAQQQTRNEPNLFSQFKGHWMGTLTYRDYQTDQDVSIAVEMELQPLAGNPASALLAVRFPGEGGHDFTDTLFYEGVAPAAGARELVWQKEKSGLDNDLPATLRASFAFGAEEIRQKNEVRYAERSTFFTRNEFVLHKTK